ncbi:MAG: chemotaxis protein CheX [Epsilonproteobacteria bacterium]|nr:chemotaxis protein CheX [Campylobacterota bacterium]
MFDILKRSATEFANSLDATLEECNEKNIRGYVSKISIKGDENYDIFVVLPKDKLDLVSELFFGDTEYETDDLSNEIANLIIGNAKVQAEDKNIKFNISTPEFLGEYTDIEHDEMYCFKMNGKDFYILLKEK